MARKIELDWEIIKGMCQCLCTGEEIASVCGVHRDALNNSCKRVHGMTFKEFWDENSSKGKASVRRAQYKLAVDHLNPTMAIWLGKQVLGQSDKADHNVKMTVPTFVDTIPDPDE